MLIPIYIREDNPFYGLFQIASLFFLGSFHFVLSIRHFVVSCEVFVWMKFCTRSGQSDKIVATDGQMDSAHDILWLCGPFSHLSTWIIWFSVQPPAADLQNTDYVFKWIRFHINDSTANKPYSATRQGGYAVLLNRAHIQPEYRWL